MCLPKFHKKQLENLSASSSMVVDMCDNKEEFDGNWKKRK
jgi:hypothetical protein